MKTTWGLVGTPLGIGITADMEFPQPKVALGQSIVYPKELVLKVRKLVFQS